MNDALMRRAVARWGLHVVCLVCVWRGRHRPERDGRLRFRTCPKCHKPRSLRMSDWAKLHKERANEQRRELMAQMPLL